VRTAYSGGSVPLQSDHHSGVRFHVTRKAYERFYVANVDFASAILGIDQYPKSKIGGSLFD